MYAIKASSSDISDHPLHLEISLTAFCQPPGRPDTLAAAIDIQFQKSFRIVGRSSLAGSFFYLISAKIGTLTLLNVMF